MDELEIKVRQLYSDVYRLLDECTEADGAFSAGLREGYTDVLTLMIRRDMV